MSEVFFTENGLLTKVFDASGAGTSDVTSSSVDMGELGGFDAVVFFTSYGTPAADNLFHVEQSSDDASADAFTDIEGSEVDLAGASDEDQFIDIINPEERYVRLVAERGTSSTLGDIWAYRYRAKAKAQDNTTTGTMVGNTLVSPVAGTK